MSAERESIERLLASISDGAPGDWSAVERAATAGDRARFETLRDLERIAEFHRELQRAPETPPAAERWGELMVLTPLGAGARANVYRAWDAKLQREVALKLMPEGAADAALIEEGRALARVRHPNVVTVYGADRHDGRVGLWMELIRGTSVERQVRASGALAPAEARRLGIEIGSALAAVHAAGLLHRDVKPANVVRAEDGRFVLADFGLGGERGEAALGASGTPMYMAPERLAGGAATECSEVYALGLLLWFALAGRHPFDTDRFDELVELARAGPRPALRERAPGTPALLARIVEQAIAPDSQRRFASARSLVTALEASAPLRRGVPARLVAAAAVAALVVLGWAALGPWRGKPAPRPAPEAAGPPALPDYAVEVNFMKRERAGTTALATGDRVKPGDRLMLEFHASRSAWVYVLNEDERGERYLLFPQPRFDAKNPLAAESTFVLPGTIGGRESAWRVTSAGGREHFLVVASPAPVAEIEAELGRLPAPDPARPIEYARVGDAAVEHLRGVGGIDESPPPDPHAPARTSAFDRFRALAGRESGVRGVWVRQVVLENPGR
jgi:hypothetical protein